MPFWLIVPKWFNSICHTHPPSMEALMASCSLEETWRPWGQSCNKQQQCNLWLEGCQWRWWCKPSALGKWLVGGGWYTLPRVVVLFFMRFYSFLWQTVLIATGSRIQRFQGATLWAATKLGAWSARAVRSCLRAPCCCRAAQAQLCEGLANLTECNMSKHLQTWLHDVAWLPNIVIT